MTQAFVLPLQCDPQGLANDGRAWYKDYACTHALCNAYHLRELAVVYKIAGVNARKVSYDAGWCGSLRYDLMLDYATLHPGFVGWIWPKCKGPMQVIALIEAPGVIRRSLAYLGFGLWSALTTERNPPLGAASWLRCADLALTYHPLCSALHNGCNAECTVMRSRIVEGPDYRSFLIFFSPHNYSPP